MNFQKRKIKLRKKRDNITQRKLLNPKNDYVFKRIFGHVGNEDITKALLNNFLDYELEFLSQIPKYLTKWNIREKDYVKNILTEDFECYIIEMSKYKKYHKDRNIWIEFINNPEVKMENKEVKKAKEILEEISSDENEIYLAELREKYLMDQVAIEEAGIEKGIKQGLQQGLQQGIKNEKLEIAKKLKNKNYDIDEIISITGLSKEEIELI